MYPETLLPSFFQNIRKQKHFSVSITMMDIKLFISNSTNFYTVLNKIKKCYYTLSKQIWEQIVSERT